MLFAVAGLAGLAGAATWVPSLNRQRVSAGLVAAAIPEAAQPGMMVGPLLAIGRAPVVDYLWLRATKLKEEGRYFDAYQLAETICKLQPRFGSVWAFNAWNMAYNISVTLKSPEERWRWVRNGFELLRDHGIPRNPRNTQLYRELAWILFHKVGDFLDDQHWYYKLQFALMVEDILGPGADHDYAAMAALPHTWEALAKDEQVAAFAKTLSALGHDCSKPGAFISLLSQKNLPDNVAALMTDAGFADVRRKIDLFWRTKRLRDEMKIDPARVVELQKVYGPFDLRLAESHALYWASLGTEIGTDKRAAYDIDRLNADRIELYCLQNFFRRGRLIMSPSARQGEPPMLLPDVRFADKLREACIAVSKNYPKQPADGEISANFQSVLFNFMRVAALRFNEAGQIEKSREYYDWLVKNNPDPIYRGGYEAFIQRMWLEDQELMQFQNAQARLLVLMGRAAQLIAYGEYEQGASSLAYARRLWTRYEKEQVHDRGRLPKFEEMFEFVVREMGKRMRPETYERLLRRTGISPVPTTRPASG
ncbi:MAG: hypothetical protein L6Q92_14390 [Phycisphaerae bacterium]|nr:hypothetical protein [Phycisphaerae bacterium]